jgi:hypothetical protein
MAATEDFCGTRNRPYHREIDGGGTSVITAWSTSGTKKSSSELGCRLLDQIAVIGELARV